MEKHNKVIREALQKKNLPVWFLKNILGRSESTVTRMMREELPESDQIRIAKMVEEWETRKEA